MSPNEVFDTNYDYQLAAERKNAPAGGNELRLLGRVAQLFTADAAGAKKIQDRFDGAVKWWKALKQKRRDEKADRTYNGSLAEISDNIIPFDEAYELKPNPHEPSKVPRPVLASPGVYRSNYSGEQPQTEPTANEMDDIMRGAVQRARKNLGTLPVITTQNQNPDTSPGTDDALLAHLEKAYARPATIPNRPYEGHHRAKEPPQDDDTLVATNGK